MPRYKLIIQMDPAAGKEDEFADYYAPVHVHDVCTVPGVLGGQLLRQAVTISDGGAPPWIYMVQYDVDTDDPQALMTEIRERMASGEVRSRGELLGTPRRAVFYETASELFPGTPAKSA